MPSIFKVQDGVSATYTQSNQQDVGQGQKETKGTHKFFPKKRWPEISLVSWPLLPEKKAGKCHVYSGPLSTDEKLYCSARRGKQLLKNITFWITSAN